MIVDDPALAPGQFPGFVMTVVHNSQDFETRIETGLVPESKSKARIPDGLFVSEGNVVA